MPYEWTRPGRVPFELMEIWTTWDLYGEWINKEALEDRTMEATEEASQETRFPSQTCQQDTPQRTPARRRENAFGGLKKGFLS